METSKIPHLIELSTEVKGQKLVLYRPVMSQWGFMIQAVIGIDIMASRKDVLEIKRLWTKQKEPSELGIAFDSVFLILNIFRPDPHGLAKLISAILFTPVNRARLEAPDYDKFHSVVSDSLNDSDIVDIILKLLEQKEPDGSHPVADAVLERSGLKDVVEAAISVAEAEEVAENQAVEP